MMISTLPGCLIFLVFTAACVVQDLRSLRIDLHIFLAMAGAELLWYPTAYLSGSSPDLRSLFAAAGAGVLLLLLSAASSGAFGEGDALFFLLLGTAAGHRMQLLILFFSVLLSGVFALLFLVLTGVRGQSAGKKALSFSSLCRRPCLLFSACSVLLKGGVLMT